MRKYINTSDKKYINTSDKWTDVLPEVTVNHYLIQAEISGIKITLCERIDGLYINGEKVADAVDA